MITPCALHMSLVDTHHDFALTIYSGKLSPTGQLWVISYPLAVSPPQNGVEVNSVFVSQRKPRDYTIQCYIVDASA